MTKYYTITNREDNARIGTLNISNEKIKTPFLIDDNESTLNICNIGSIWSFQEIEKELDEIIMNIHKQDKSKIIILPRIKYSLSYPIFELKKKQQFILKKFNDIVGSYPTAVLYRSEHNKNKSNQKQNERFTLLKMKNDPLYDIYILDGIKSTNQNIHILFSLIENAKSSIPFDSALYIPNIATPLNISLFVYLGVDIFDTTKIKYCSLNDIYFVNNGFFNVMELKSIPCNCNICKTISLKDLTLMSQQKKFNFLYLHNLNVLKSEISIIKEKIIRNDLRNYVESKCKTDTYLSGILRLYDQSRYYTNSTAIYKNGQLISTSSESLLRSDVKTFYSRIHERYKKPKKDILLILPCSSKKPYSLSKSHRKIMNSIGENKRYIHEIILTSPLGIVPRELEIIYPSSYYDTTVTGYWDNNEIEFLKLMLRKYLTKNKYKYIVAHVSIEYQKICKEIEKELDIKIIYTSTEESNILSENNLNNLNSTIHAIISKDKNINKLTSFSDKINLFRAIIYYQFGFIPETIFINPKVKNRYQKYELYSNNVLMAIISYDSKLMTFSLEGVKKIMMDNQYKGQYTVYVENFKPKGSILSPGIISSDIQIKPNDTVFIKGKNLFGIGKAFMSGYEMCNSQKGEAISIKNIKIEDN